MEKIDQGMCTYILFLQKIIWVRAHPTTAGYRNHILLSSYTFIWSLITLCSIMKASRGLFPRTAQSHKNIILQTDLQQINNNHISKEIFFPSKFMGLTN